jgi:DNA repair exonuclease SbcCD ATPase subunit
MWSHDRDGASTAAARGEGAGKSRRRTLATLAAVIGVAWASYETYRRVHELIALAEQALKYPVERIQKEKELIEAAERAQQQLNRIEQKLAQIEEETKTSAEKADRADRAARAALGKIDRLRTPQGSAQAEKFPPLLGFRPLPNAKPDM